MCGIAGWYDTDGTPVDEAALACISNQLIHRGPDDHGIWLAGNVGLAHRRLSIRDLSSDGRQPMSDAGRRVFVTFNGEIYNDDPLRNELERDFGFKFHSSCDTEVLPYAYLAWGHRHCLSARGDVRYWPLGCGARAPVASAGWNRNQTPALCRPQRCRNFRQRVKGSASKPKSLLQLFIPRPYTRTLLPATPGLAALYWPMWPRFLQGRS